MDQISVESGLAVPLADNQAKRLGLAVAESVPMLWGTGAIGRAATGRFMAQLAENAKLPAVHGGLPEVGHNQIVAFDGPLAPAPSDIFADPVESPAQRQLHLVLMRDEAEHEAVARRVAVIERMVEQRGLVMTELHARGTHRLSRMATLTVLTDWASVYAAVAMGVDPTPIGPIDRLKAGLREEDL
jgi:glucose/mannose-6-phosphate isomerase